MSTLIVVGTVQSRVKQATSRLSSRLNSVDNKLVERLMINEERKTMNVERLTRTTKSIHENSLFVGGEHVS
jgi:division protein CdvB (Snf7/Vps24/ESCRT-III family)